jgi:hypothetical protein
MLKAAAIVMTVMLIISVILDVSEARQQTAVLLLGFFYGLDMFLYELSKLLNKDL